MTHEWTWKGPRYEALRDNYEHGPHGGGVTAEIMGKLGEVGRRFDAYAGKPNLAVHAASVVAMVGVNDPAPASLVERVARALCRRQWPDASEADIDDMWDGWEGDALVAIAAMREPADTSGYATAFFELAAMMGLGAQPLSPEQVWEGQMKPRLAKMLSERPA